MTAQKIGLISGTFDPIHLGHIELAKEAKRQLKLDTVFILPEKVSRYKTGVTAYEHRQAMCRLATAEYDWIDVCEVSQPTHDFATIEELKYILPDAEFTLIIGADVAAHFESWKDANKIKGAVSVVSFGRNQAAGDIEFDHPASSRQLRESLNRAHLPGEVVDYIHEHELYQS